MQYLTNYYKNLAEQLQEQVTALEQVLMEAGFKKAMRRAKKATPEALTALQKEQMRQKVRQNAGQHPMHSVDFVNRPTNIARNIQSLENEIYDIYDRNPKLIHEPEVDYWLEKPVKAFHEREAEVFRGLARAHEASSKERAAGERGAKLKHALNRMNEKRLDRVGEEDGDIDNDGDKDKTDKYLLHRREAIGKAMRER